MTTAQSAIANTAPAIEYNVAAGTLTQALNQFALQSGVKVSVDSQKLAGLYSPGLQGKYSVLDGFAKLLKNTPYQIQKIDQGYTIIEKIKIPSTQARDMGQLKTIDVNTNGQLNSDANAVQLPVIEVTAENDSYTAKPVSIGGKTARDFKEVQQSVSVITAKRIKDQNLNNLTDVLEQTTGININKMGNSERSIYSRGLTITSVQFDGGAPSYLDHNLVGNTLPDMAAYDQVEVLRGSDGLFSGSGEAGGTINLVRKRPLDHFQFKTDTSVGSWDHYRQQFDVTDALNQAGTVRGRFVAAQENQHYYYDVAKDKTSNLYGIIEADLGDQTKFAVGVNYLKRDSVPNYFGMPRYSTGQELGVSKKTNYTTPWSYYDTERTQIFTEITQKIADNWQLKINGSWEKNKVDKNYTWFIGSVGLNGIGNGYYYTQERGDSIQKLLDVTLTGSFDIWGHKQELAIGANWQDLNQKSTSIDHGSISLDVINFDPDDYPASAWSSDGYSISNPYGQKQWGGYLSLRSELTSKLHSIIGGRYSNYHNVYYNYSYDNDGTYTGLYSWDYKKNNIWTPYFGLTYDLLPNTSLYTSYASVFKPQNSIGIDGKFIDPIEGNSIEIGTKNTWLDGRLNSSLALYQTNRENEAVAVGKIDNIQRYAPSAKIQVRGVEAELTGNINTNWDFTAGYTWSLAKYKEGYARDGQRYNAANYPRHLFKLWTMYRPESMEKLRFGGGVNLRSAQEVSGTVKVYDSSGTQTGTADYTYNSPFLAVFGLRAEYDINKNWNVGLNINNVFDRTYFSRLSGTNYGNIYGDPRNFMLTISGKY